MTALAVVVALVLPDATGWPQPPVTVLAFALVAGGLLLQMLSLYHHLAGARERDGQRMEQLEHRLDDIEAAMGEVREGSQAGDERSAEMLQELRVLQTLLGQIVERSGGETTFESDMRAADTESSATSNGQDTQPRTTSRLSGEQIRDILRGALSENRVDLYLQPTVSLPSRRTQHYECFSRLRGEDGQVLYPTEYLSVAEGAGLAGSLDNLLLFRCIQLIRKLGGRRPETRFFCNISSASLHDADFFPQFLEYMAMNTELADRLVFEFTQEDFASVGTEERRRLNSLGRAGYRFSLDHVASRQIDPKSLADQHVAFVKIDVAVLCADGDEPSPQRLRDRLARHGISLVASKVEEETDVLELLEMDIELAQGYLFGEPRLSRDEPR